METALLATKLFIPPLKPGLVSRPRLVKRMQATLDHSFTLISAPAGFGKTTLISEWIHNTQPRIPTAWLSLEETENDPVRFWDYSVAALRTIQLGIGESSLALLHSSQPPPIESVLTALLNDLAKVSADFVLVLDDYHFVTSEPIHSGLNFLLEHLPPKIHLVVSTRVSPPLPLAHLRGKGSLWEIRADDLRFTFDETESLFRQLQNPELTMDDLKALQIRTEGWAVGLKMAVLSLQSEKNIPKFISSFTGGQRYIMDYLLEDVLQKQTTEIQEFLLKTSILERLSGSLCDVLTGGVNGKGTLLRLEKANLFLIPLDLSYEWYRYHHLFAELLRHRLEFEKGKEAAAELHNKASRWFEANEFPEEAVQHALYARDWERAISLIFNPTIFYPRMGTATFLKWIHQIPEDLLRSHPNLYIHYLWQLSWAGRYEALETHLNSLEEISRNDVHLQHRIATLRAAVSNAMGKFELAEEYAKRALSLLNLNEAEAKLPEDTDDQASACLHLGYSYLWRYRMRDAEPLFMQSRQLYQQLGMPAAVALAQLLLGVVFQAEARYREAEKILKEISEKPPVQIQIQANAHGTLGQIYYEWNDLESAAFHREKAIELLRPWGGEVGQDVPFLWMVPLRLAQGDLNRAEQAIAEADRLRERSKPNLVGEARNAAFHVCLAAHQNDAKAFDRWLDKFAELEPNMPLDIHPVCWYRYYRRKGRAAANERWSLDYERFTRSGSTSTVIFTLIFQALDAPDYELGLPFLAKALEICRPEGIVRSFVDMGMELAPLLKKAISRGIESNFAAKLLTIIETEERQRRMRNGEISTTSVASGLLSGRELEILRLMSEGLSNPQIATKLIVSLNTTKTHVRHILDKLNARSRAQAITLAKELKLI